MTPPLPPYPDDDEEYASPEERIRALEDRVEALENVDPPAPVVVASGPTVGSVLALGLLGGATVLVLYLIFR